VYNITHACDIKHLQKCPEHQGQIIYAQLVTVLPVCLCLLWQGCGTLCNLLEASLVR